MRSATLLIACVVCGTTFSEESSRGNARGPSGPDAASAVGQTRAQTSPMQGSADDKSGDGDTSGLTEQQAAGGWRIRSEQEKLNETIRKLTERIDSLDTRLRRLEQEQR